MEALDLVLVWLNNPVLGNITVRLVISCPSLQAKPSSHTQMHPIIRRIQQIADHLATAGSRAFMSSRWSAACDPELTQDLLEEALQKLKNSGKALNLLWSVSKIQTVLMYSMITEAKQGMADDEGGRHLKKIG